MDQRLHVRRRRDLDAVVTGLEVVLEVPRRRQVRGQVVHPVEGHLVCVRCQRKVRGLLVRGRDELHLVRALQEGADRRVVACERARLGPAHLSGPGAVARAGIPVGGLAGLRVGEAHDRAVARVVDDHAVVAREHVGEVRVRGEVDPVVVGERVPRPLEGRRVGLHRAAVTGVAVVGCLEDGRAQGDHGERADVTVGEDGVAGLRSDEVRVAARRPRIRWPCSQRPRGRPCRACRWWRAPAPARSRRSSRR